MPESTHALINTLHHSVAPARFVVANAVASLCWAVPLALIPYWVNEYSHQFLHFSKECRWVAYLLVVGLICTAIGVSLFSPRKSKVKL